MIEAEVLALDPNAAIFGELHTCERIKKALLGCCKLDIVAPGNVEIRFGIRNVRPLNMQAVKRLQHSFYMEGVRRNSGETVIQIGMKRAEVKMEKLKAFGTEMKDFTMMKDVLVEEGRVRIQPYSGQHRVEAMKTFKEYLTERKDRVVLEVDAIDQRLKDLNGELKKDGVTAEETKGLGELIAGLKMERSGLMKDVAKIKGLEKSGGEWVFEIYDIGEL